MQTHAARMRMNRRALTRGHERQLGVPRAVAHALAVVALQLCHHLPRDDVCEGVCA